MTPLLRLWNDPFLMNYFIMSIYLLTSVRWVYFGSYADACYWMSALAITATVTWGYGRSIS